MREVGSADDQAGEETAAADGRQKSHDASVAETAENGLGNLESLHKVNHVGGHILVVDFRGRGALAVPSGIQGVDGKALGEPGGQLVKDLMGFLIAVEEDDRISLPALFVPDDLTVQLNDHNLFRSFFQCKDPCAPMPGRACRCLAGTGFLCGRL